MAVMAPLPYLAQARRRSRLARIHRGTALAAAAIALLVSANVSAKPKKKKHKPAPAPAATAAPGPALELDEPPATAATPAAPAPPPPPSAPAAPAAAAESDSDTEEATPAPAAAAHGKGLPPMGRAKTLVFDDLSGFRASTLGGAGYTGPLGFNAQSFGESVPAANGSNAGTDTYHVATFWFAPSADYFVFDHFSVGALVQIAIVATSYDESLFGSPTRSSSLPTTTNVTVLPRAGWLFQLSDHWGLWPRLGLGGVSHSSYNLAAAGAGATSNSGSYSGFIVDIDAGLLYRMDQAWFLRAGPELTFGVGSSMVSFSIAAGFGYMWNL